MAEFYVTYEQGAKRFLAVVIAPERPACFRFASREALLGTMDSLGHVWQLQGEISDEVAGQVSDDWLERMAKVGEIKSVPKPDCYLFGVDGPSVSGDGLGH